MSFHRHYRKKSGFTLIELLVAVLVVSILAGVLTSVINPTLQQNRADDAVKRSRVVDLAQGVEAFVISEETVPTTPGVAGDPPVATGLTTYVVWPEYAEGYVYRAGGSSDFLIYTQASEDTSTYITYFSPTGHVLLCTAAPTNPASEAGCN